MEKRTVYRILSCMLAFVICIPMVFSGKAYAAEIPNNSTAIEENYWAELQYVGKANGGLIPVVKGAISYGNMLKNLKYPQMSNSPSVGVYKDINTISYKNGVDEFDKLSRPELVTNNGANGDSNYQANRYHNPFNFDFYRDFIRNRDQLNIYGDISINGNTGDKEITTYKVGDKLTIEMTVDLSNLYKWEVTRYWQIINGPTSGMNWQTYGTDGHIASNSSLYFRLRLPEGIEIPQVYDSSDDTYKSAVKYTVEGLDDKSAFFANDYEKDGCGNIDIPISPKLGGNSTMPIKDYFNCLKRLGVVKVRMEGLVVKSDVPKNEKLSFEGSITGSKETAFFPTRVKDSLPDYSGNHDDYVNNLNFFAAKQSDKGRDKAAAPDKPNLMSFTFQVKKPGSQEEPTPDSVKRLAGDDRYQTSIKVARELKKTMKVKDFNAVVVANGDNYADALSGAYLAKVKNAPLVLVNKNNTEQALRFIYDNLKHVKKGQTKSTVYLLGESDVVPEVMRTELEEYFNIRRIEGPDRFDTNLEVLKEANVNNEEILICSGYGFADSLAASATGRPIMLVGRNLTPKQRAYLKSIKSRKYTLIGDSGPVSNAVEASLKSLGSTTRVYGADRYETSVAVAKHFFKNPKTVVIGYGDNFPDGLCGGVLAERRGAPLLLINSRNADFAKQYVKANSINSQIVLGDSDLISNKTVNYIVK